MTVKGIFYFKKVQKYRQAEAPRYHLCIYIYIRGVYSSGYCSTGWNLVLIFFCNALSGGGMF